MLALRRVRFHAPFSRQSLSQGAETATVVHGAAGAPCGRRCTQCWTCEYDQAAYCCAFDSSALDGGAGKRLPAVATLIINFIGLLPCAAER